MWNFIKLTLFGLHMCIAVHGRNLQHLDLNEILDAQIKPIKDYVIAPSPKKSQPVVIPRMDESIKSILDPFTFLTTSTIDLLFNPVNLSAVRNTIDMVGIDQVADNLVEGLEAALTSSQAMSEAFNILDKTLKLPKDVFKDSGKVVRSLLPNTLATNGFGGLTELANELFKTVNSEWEKIVTKRLLQDDKYMKIYTETNIPVHKLCSQMGMTTADGDCILTNSTNSLYHIIRQLQIFSDQINQFIVGISNGFSSALNQALKSLEVSLTAIANDPQNPETWAKVIKELERTIKALEQFLRTFLIIDPVTNKLFNETFIEAREIFDNIIHQNLTEIPPYFLYDVYKNTTGLYYKLLTANNTILFSRQIETIRDFRDLELGLVKIVFDSPVTEDLQNLTTGQIEEIIAATKNITNINLFEIDILDPAKTLGTLVHFVTSLSNITNLVNMVQTTLVITPKLGANFAGSTVTTAMHVVEDLLSMRSEKNVLITLSNVTNLFMNFLSDLLKDVQLQNVFTDVGETLNKLTTTISQQFTGLFTSLLGSISLFNIYNDEVAQVAVMGNELEPHSPQLDYYLKTLIKVIQGQGGMSKRQVEMYEGHAKFDINNIASARALGTETQISPALKLALDSLLSNAIGYASLVQTKGFVPHDIVTQIQEKAYQLTNDPKADEHNLGGQAGKRKLSEEYVSIIKQLKTALVDKIPVLKSEIALYLDLKASDCKKLASAIEIVSKKDLSGALSLREKVFSVCTANELNDYVAEFDRVEQEFERVIAQNPDQIQQEIAKSYEDIVAVAKQFLAILQKEKATAEERAELIKALYN